MLIGIARAETVLRGQRRFVPFCPTQGRKLTGRLLPVVRCLENVPETTEAVQIARAETVLRGQKRFVPFCPTQGMKGAE